MNSLKIALELYTVRDETKRDFVGTLRKVAQMGYTAVEFAGYGDLSAQQMASLLAETGLKAAATHVGLNALEGDALDKSIDYCLAISCPNLVLPSLPPQLRAFESIQTLAPQLNAIGQHCRERGIAFGYHNHDFEFKQENGRYWIDELLQLTDSALVKLELDVYWAAYAGVDPVDFLRQHLDRVFILHLKDMTPERGMTEVGSGVLDMRALCSIAQERGLWGIVEHDAPTLPSLESAKRSLDYLQQLTL
ncbi:MAG TPA: sugar phosphate isomerase/epimerase [Ktedonobacteraceae bacterium]|jgi:sugar phosphate isomerase/epimerase|nr:sugar phosphate isomerase/epimerase [Ktedonobacteraceae bacterium]